MPDADMEARVAALVAKAQNAAWNGLNEADRVAAKVTEQLVAMTERQSPERDRRGGDMGIYPRMQLRADAPGGVILIVPWPGEADRGFAPPASVVQAWREALAAAEGPERDHHGGEVAHRDDLARDVARLWMAARRDLPGQAGYVPRGVQAALDRLADAYDFNAED